MEVIASILKISLYYCGGLLAYWFVCLRRNALSKRGAASQMSRESPRQAVKLHAVEIALVSLAIGFFSVICGATPELSDRAHFQVFFESGLTERVKAGSFGLYVVEEILHSFTNNASVLFFVIAFLVTAILLASYNRFPQRAPIALMFVAFSFCYLYGCYQLKEAVAVAFATLALASYFAGRKVLCIGGILAAIQFHEVAYILIPLLLLLHGAKRKSLVVFEALLLAVCVFEFSEISSAVIKLVNNLIPGMSLQTTSYLNQEGGISVESNYMTVLKGLPYYLITIIAIAYRGKLQGSIKNYDKFLILSIFVSLTSIMSFYSYWLWRFGELCYFADFVFAGLIVSTIPMKKEGQLFTAATALSSLVLSARYFLTVFFTYGGII
ncbi:EpsG family protein [Adlercreutzia sp. ZJ473]|uniref:EpsG family protein n=1 Tax=Adlercreutzia sp. ZJ473 TaxID=2722822 RepID=UPI0015581D8B|nr:EpsG family protein [Adlercreutzia sp. ZJ473]